MATGNYSFSGRLCIFWIVRLPTGECDKELNARAALLQVAGKSEVQTKNVGALSSDDDVVLARAECFVFVC